MRKASEPKSELSKEARKQMVLDVALEHADIESVLVWYETYVLEGFGKTASELVEQGRHEAVVTHLKRKSLGGFA